MNSPANLKIDIGKNETFMEAPWMHKRDGKYYFNFHTRYIGKIDIDDPDDPKRNKSRLDYSWGKSPWDPLEYGGILNTEVF